METQVDIPTLRVQLDSLLRDHAEFSQTLTTKQQQHEQLSSEIFQYRGALTYNLALREKIEAVLKTATTPSA